MQRIAKNGKTLARERTGIRGHPRAFEGAQYGTGFPVRAGGRRRAYFIQDRRRLGWPRSGFGAYIGPRIEEREGLLQVARYIARAPVAESRLRYYAERAEVELVADRTDGPYAGVRRFLFLPR